MSNHPIANRPLTNRPTTKCPTDKTSYGTKRPKRHNITRPLPEVVGCCEEDCLEDGSVLVLTVPTCQENY